MKLAHTINPDKTEQHALKPVTKQKVLLGQLRPQPGQKLWEMNLVDYSIAEAVLTQDDVMFKPDGSVKPVRSINVKESHIYCVAINEKNAKKHFVNRLKKQMEQYYKNKAQVNQL